MGCTHYKYYQYTHIKTTNFWKNNNNTSNIAKTTKTTNQTRLGGPASRPRISSKAASLGLVEGEIFTVGKMKIMGTMNLIFLTKTNWKTWGTNKNHDVFFCTNQCDGLWWLFDVTRNSIIWDTLSVIPSIYPSKWKYMKVIFWEEVIWGSNNYPVKSILWLTNIVTWNEQDISCKLEGSLWQLYHSKLKSLLERRSLAIQNGKTRLTTGLDKQPRILLGFWDPMCEFGGQSDQSTILY